MIDLSKVNKDLKAGKRPKQSVGTIPAELKEVAKQKAKLETKVGQLQRDVRKRMGPALTIKPKSKPVRSHAELERLYFEQEARKLVR